MQKQGFQRVKIDGIIHELNDLPDIDKNKKHTIEVVVDRIAISDDLGNRLPDSIETALRLSEGLLLVEIVSVPEKSKGKSGNELKTGTIITYSSKFACPVSGFTLTR